MTNGLNTGAIAKLSNIGKIGFDLLLIGVAYFGAYLIRFDGVLNEEYRTLFTSSLPFVLIVYLFLFYIAGVYRRVWKYSSIRDLLNIAVSNTIAAIVITLIFRETRFIPIPRTVMLITWLLVFMTVGGPRFILRVYMVYLPFWRQQKKRLLVVGAGNAGEMVVRQTFKEPSLGYKPVCFVDDDWKLQFTLIHGVPVAGTIDDLPRLVVKKKIDEIVISTPSATASEMRRIVEMCEKASVPFKTIPGPKELMQGNFTLQKIRKVRIEDLLERTPAGNNCELLAKSLKDQVVLVTGAAGSIGSELCRQLLNFDLKRLILIDRAESDLFDLELELSRKESKASIFSKLADITNKEKILKIFQKHQPDIVFHAAAYKHVPFLERYPDEAVYNNVFGTINTLNAASQVATKRFILISTDKAVNPTNVMGATKRITEIYCLSQNGKLHLDPIVVRFGNVLGSKGSVVPLFQEQISMGGPVTVTNKEITRYFMTIPESVELVMHAGLMGEGGNVYILDMGEPLNIYQMARHLISLSGLEPDKDIKIEFIGLRPGEKMFEELWYSDEDPVRTNHPQILKSQRLSLKGAIGPRSLVKLQKVMEKNDYQKILSELKEIVTTFTYDLASVEEEISVHANGNSTHQ